ncbi:methionine--tRNA ligase subunit beta [Candidatus Daviesbacteria bacterium]|nr:methionine--tRNA ligase subunit beta [Candidatus Daviesbacteria bacterium]
MITIDDFSKVEFKVGTVLEAEEVPGSDKLIKQIVDFGDEKRQILSGIKQWYKPKQLTGKQFVYVTNLEPRTMMGLQSQGMLLCADGKKPIPLKPSSKVPPGSKIR